MRTLHAIAGATLLGALFGAALGGFILFVQWTISHIGVFWTCVAYGVAMCAFVAGWSRFWEVQRWKEDGDER